MIREARGNERGYNPRGLNCRWFGGDELIFAVRPTARFAPSALFVLMHLQPIRAGGNARLVAGNSGREQTADRPGRPMQEPRVGCAVPTSVAPLSCLKVCNSTLSRGTTCRVQISG
jgi:hypothetical protein